MAHNGRTLHSSHCVGGSLHHDCSTGTKVHCMRAGPCCNRGLLNPVYKCAQVRAKQHYGQDGDRTRNMGVLLHGDGAFSGQVSGAPHPAALHAQHTP